MVILGVIWSGRALRCAQTGLVRQAGQPDRRVSSITDRCLLDDVRNNEATLLPPRASAIRKLKHRPDDGIRNDLPSRLLRPDEYLPRSAILYCT